MKIFLRNKPPRIEAGAPSDMPFSSWLIVSFLILALLKLWLVSGQNLTAIGWAIHDDRLYLKLARSLSKGHWLGDYDHFTLIKGLFYPMWIAIAYKVGIPLLLSQHLLYISACVVSVIAVRPLLPGPKMLLLVYTILLFNPMSYSGSMMTRVIREGIYPALTLFITSAAVGMITRYDRPIRTLRVWAVLSGIFFSAFWLTREEGIWILPLIFILLASLSFNALRMKPVDWHRLYLVWGIPLCIWLFANGAIAGVNKACYGIFSTVELKSSNFLAAYGALLRVRHATPQQFIPVPQEARERIYKVSPAFAELRPFLEGDLGKEWAQHGCKELSVCTDIAGGWFIWALRDAVATAGYYSKGASEADRFYHRLSVEIDSACDNHRIDCVAKSSSLAPPWRNEYIWPLINTLSWSGGYLASFEGFNPHSVPSLGPKSSLRLFSKMTREQISPTTAEQNNLQKEGFDNFKLRILIQIGRGYQILMPIVTILSILLYCLSAIYIFRPKKNKVLWIICSALLSAIFFRLLIFSLVHVTSFPAIYPQYLAPAYPLLLIFVLLSLADYVITRTKRRKGA